MKKSAMPASLDLATLIPDFPVELLSDRAVDLLSLDQILVRQGLARHPHAAGESWLRSANNQIFSVSNGVGAAYDAIQKMRHNAPIIRLVPNAGEVTELHGNIIDIPLLNGFRLPIGTLLEQDPAATLIVSTPEPISGRIATVQEMVRLARHFALVVMDEQLAPFSLRRLTPLIEEWENLVSIQRFPFHMPGEISPFAWMVHPTAMRPLIQEHLEPVPQETIAEVMSYGQIDTFPAERYAARLKGQLWRELRKLSIVSVPYPSWGPALLAQVERGDRDEIVADLHARGIEVYAPPHPNLRHVFRATAVSPDAIQALKDALIEINLGL
ncbi:MAG: hypothetical protein KC435_05315 [Thermomicrobiales bacterium]|nr:hypothetical protein [Thermomicrobiales bacterium]